MCEGSGDMEPVWDHRALKQRLSSVDLIEYSGHVGHKSTAIITDMIARLCFRGVVADMVLCFVDVVVRLRF